MSVGQGLSIERTAQFCACWQLGYVATESGKPAALRKEYLASGFVP